MRVRVFGAILALLTVCASAGVPAAAQTGPVEHGVVVVRGDPAPPPALPAQLEKRLGGEAADGGTGVWRVFAGRTLWLVSPSGRRVVACRVVGTGMVGERKVRCTPSHVVQGDR